MMAVAQKFVVKSKANSETVRSEQKPKKNYVDLKTALLDYNLRTGR